MDYHFFNHGAFFSFAGLKDPEEDPINDWYARQNMPHLKILRQVFETPVFSGLIAPAAEGRGVTWDHVLCGVPNELWPSLFEFLGSVSTVDQRADNGQGAIYMACAAPMVISDPVMVDRYTVLRPNLPQVAVTVFGIESNLGQWLLQPCPPQQPRVMQSAARPAIIKLWRDYSEGDFSSLQERCNPAFQDFTQAYEEVRKQAEFGAWREFTQ